MKYLTKDIILKRLTSPKEQQGNNIMGVSESFYDEFYLLNEFFKREKIEAKTLSEVELNRLLRLADFASEVFY